MVLGYAKRSDIRQVTTVVGLCIQSPSVGKSCFLMLLGLYMTCVENRKVLIVRRVKEGDVSLCFSLATPSRGREALVLIDGYSQAYVDSEANGLLPFHHLATSCQYDAKHDDPSHIVVLPAWQRDDLEQYARLTNWVISTGFRKTKTSRDSAWPKFVKEQQFYSGGSLREFGETREALKEQVEKDCDKVGNAQTYQLVYTYGGDRSNDQVDRVRRHYITDPNNEEHYTNSRYWKVSVDSGYALKLLGRHVGMEK